MLAVISSMLATMQEAESLCCSEAIATCAAAVAICADESVILCVLSAIKESLLRNLSSNRFKAVDTSAISSLPVTSARIVKSKSPSIWASFEI